jgi:protein-S-isoprenylcysteine O-methyltransferase Ste14
MASASGRSAKIAYGLFCYTAFLAVSGYAVGFVGNYWHLLGWKGEGFRSLDVGESAPLGEAIAVNLLLIAIFGVQHSVMARRSFKAWWARIVPPVVERSTYVLIASACIALIFWQWRPIGVVLYDVTNGALGYALAGVSLVGWLIVVAATFLIDHAGLFGLRQVFRGPGDAEAPSASIEFQTPGLYRTVRHPLYFGFLVAFWATPVMTVGHLLFALGLTLYTLVAIPFEERDLADLYGDKYRDYQRRVRALLPFPR